MPTFLNVVLIFCTIAFFSSCEEAFIPDTGDAPPDIVVEGYIEAGDRLLPAFVILTWSQPFFSELTPELLEGLFIHDARVTVTDGKKTVQLTERCYEELNDLERAALRQFLGVSGDSLAINFCVYIDDQLELPGEAGKQYDLRVEVEDRVVTASTTIPQGVPLDSLQFVRPAGNPPDTLLELRAFISDPADIASYYRYFTSVGDEPLIPGLSSVFDDLFFDGMTFEFPLPKAQRRTDPIVQETFGLYRRGKNATIKWTTIDEAHHDFWNTLEFNAVNQGPFSTFTRIDSNVEGGLGIWGGYNAAYYNLKVEL